MNPDYVRYVVVHHFLKRDTQKHQLSIRLNFNLVTISPDPPDIRKSNFR